ncbi:beta/gamma crystallin domain-containing protein [Streptomyces lancefieldiae]|uniref:Beta/gamma crystallin domain-containing protein n=1 Tax=Streptomyces lancefieldiae TaxID=3075520 RepID=A0ABU3AYW8_9ACTN|nr:beta/gamma crystallin domain-containing protein [Streptomyces sp. DSM 40712]MDT0614777.1 beta/gamma crystallin domain-containing protein [Streptomyces sp. DSM 40712]
MKKNRPVRAKVLFKKIAVTAAVAAGFTVAIPATPAAAVSSVDCRWPSTINEYARVESYGLPTCFANAGAMNVNVHGVSMFHSGNNKVTFFYTIEGGTYQNAITLEKWQERGLAFNATAHLTSLVIW